MGTVEPPLIDNGTHSGMRVNIAALVKIATFVAIVATAYWYWSGPWQEKTHPSYESILKQNAEKMSLCVRGAAYKQGATGNGVNEEVARERCAEELNLYELDGRWHSYDMARPDEAESG